MFLEYEIGVSMEVVSSMQKYLAFRGLLEGSLYYYARFMAFLMSCYFSGLVICCEIPPYNNSIKISNIHCKI